MPGAMPGGRRRPRWGVYSCLLDIIYVIRRKVLDKCVEAVYKHGHLGIGPGCVGCRWTGQKEVLSMGMMADVSAGTPGSECRVRFNVLLRDAEKEMLERVAAVRRCSKGMVIRQAVWAAYLQEVEGKPTCANGRGCIVAHLQTAPGVSVVNGAGSGEGRG